MSSKPHTTSDYVIVGGGSAGAVLANRLSARGQTVVLIEAGHAYRPNLYPPDLANADIVTGPDGHDWGYTADTGQLGRRSPAWRQDARRVFGRQRRRGDP
jgi:choline dehydrogenase